jgi:hypothetical protein
LKFQEIVRERKAEHLKDWLAEAKASGISELERFASALTLGTQASSLQKHAIGVRSQGKPN